MSAELLKCNSGQKKKWHYKNDIYHVPYLFSLGDFQIKSAQFKNQKRLLFLTAFLSNSLCCLFNFCLKKWNYVPSVPHIIFHPLTTKILQLKYSLYLHGYKMNQNKPYLTHPSDQSKTLFFLTSKPQTCIDDMEWSNLSFSQQQTRTFHTKYIGNYMLHIYASLYVYTDTHVCVCMYTCNTHLCISTHTYLDMFSSIVLIIGCQYYFISLKYLCWHLHKMSFHI